MILYPVIYCVFIELLCGICSIKTKNHNLCWFKLKHKRNQNNSNINNKNKGKRKIRETKKGGDCISYSPDPLHLASPTSSLTRRLPHLPHFPRLLETQKP